MPAHVQSRQFAKNYRSDLPTKRSGSYYLFNDRATRAGNTPDDPLELQSDLQPEAVTSVAWAGYGAQISVIT